MTSCRDCHKTWSGQKVCHCTGCHETFSTERNFAMHQGATEGCTPPAELLSGTGKPRLALNARGIWTEPPPADPNWPDSRPSQSNPVA